MPKVLNLNLRPVNFLKLSGRGRLLTISYALLTLIALIVWTQHYFKYGAREEYSIKLSLVYNLIVYSSFALMVPIIVSGTKRFPFEADGKLKSISIHIVISTLVCLSHMMMSNILLFVIDLVSTFPFPWFIWKYMTGVIHVHFIIYWSIFAIISSSTSNNNIVSESKNLPIEMRFKVTVNNEHYFISYNDVYWIEALDHYQKLHTEKGYHIIKDSMANLEKNIPSTIFCRAHRSYFININLVKSINKGRRCLVNLKNGKSLKVSESYKSQLLSLINS